MGKVFATHAEYQEATKQLGGKGDQVGAKWTFMEEEQLRARFHQGMNIYSLAHLHGRNPNGIIARLKALDLIEYDFANERWEAIEPVLTTSTEYVSTGQTTITLKESNTMTKPLEHKAFLFGNDITKLAEHNIIAYIKQANEEINSYASIPENNYTKLRIANLKDAIEAAVKELNKRGE